MTTSIVLWIAALTLVAVGVVGLVLPGLPGAPLLFTGLVLAAWADGFAYAGWGVLALLGLMAALTYVADVLASALGARGFGASWRGMAGALGGMVIGVFFGLPGVIVGAFLGAVAGELTGRRSLPGAGWAGIGALAGLALGAAAKLAVAAAMIGVFLLARFWN